mmetsp:Transcript_1456/g.3233  ORF Transcript_1456/g.3233 Transcript_1456/m.3233 type:complete len:93 (-) Transcript_1456:26-304(-)
MKCSGLTVVSEKARRRCRDFRLRRGLEGKSRGSTTGVPSGTPPRADAGGATEDAGGAEVVARRREAEDDEGLLRAEGFFDEADIRVVIMMRE